MKTLIKISGNTFRKVFIEDSLSALKLNIYQNNSSKKFIKNIQNITKFREIPLFFLNKHYFSSTKNNREKLNENNKSSSQLGDYLKKIDKNEKNFESEKFNKNQKESYRNEENDNDEKINYDFLTDYNPYKNQRDIKDVSSFKDELEKIISEFKCKGCGIELQCSTYDKLGYIPEKKVREFLDDNKNEIDLESNLEDLKLENIEIPKDKRFLKKLKNTKLKKKDLICERCYKLKNYMRLDTQKSNENNKIDEKKKKIDNYSLLIKKIDIQKLIYQILIRLSEKSHVFYMCDITDFESSINMQVIKELHRKKCGLTFIINKYDVLPYDIIEEKIRIWTGEKLKEMIGQIDGLEYKYILVSSKNGHNFDYIIHRIKKIKEEAKEKRHLKPKIFIIGNANVGKSSFINKLIQTSNKFLNDEKKRKLFYSKNYKISDPSVVDMNQSSSENQEFKKDDEMNRFEKDIEVNLTASPLPGTTIGITKVNSMTMGIKLFDTPGIPNLSSISYLMTDYLEIISSFIIKKIKPYTINVKQGYSIWLGGTARVDMLNGSDKFFSFFLSHNVTLHKTFLLNSEKIYENQIGNLLRPVISFDLNELNLVTHSFHLKCDKMSLLNYDVCISGLGWFSISGKGFVQLDVLVPKGVSVFLRSKPMIPFQIKIGGVQKYYGNTINSNSKMNMKLKKSMENKERID